MSLQFIIICTDVILQSCRIRRTSVEHFKSTPFHTFIHLSSHFIFQFRHVVLMEYACLLASISNIVTLLQCASYQNCSICSLQQVTYRKTSELVTQCLFPNVMGVFARCQLTTSEASALVQSYPSYLKWLFKINLLHFSKYQTNNLVSKNILVVIKQYSVLEMLLKALL